MVTLYLVQREFHHHMVCVGTQWIVMITFFFLLKYKKSLNFKENPYKWIDL